jgi:hypothetical protein
MHALSLISISMDYPKTFDWKVGKTILRYIIGTIDYEI